MYVTSRRGSLRGMERAAAPGDPDRSIVQTYHADEHAGHTEYLIWHVYDAGRSTLCLKVRYRDDEEVQSWRDGPNLADALNRQRRTGGGHSIANRGARPASTPSTTSCGLFARHCPADRDDIPIPSLPEPSLPEPSRP